MFYKNAQLRYETVFPQRVVSTKFVRSANAVVNGEGTTVFLCPLGEAELLLDFEKEVVGGLTMKVRCEGAAHITVIYDEWPESAMRREPYESTWYTGLRDDFDLSEGEHTLVSEGRRGFRYAGIFASGSCTELLSVEASNGSWPHEQRGFFRCSDEKLNRIWDISVATLRACMQSF